MIRLWEVCYSKNDARGFTVEHNPWPWAFKRMEPTVPVWAVVRWADQ